MALFFCHGAFGYAHQLTVALETPAPHAEGTMLHHPGPAGNDAGGTHPAGGDYFATILALLLGTLLLVRGTVSTSFRLQVPAPEERRFPPAVFRPPREPTAPFLQVFRL